MTVTEAGPGGELVFWSSNEAEFRPSYDTYGESKNQVFVRGVATAVWAKAFPAVSHLRRSRRHWRIRTKESRPPTPPTTGLICLAT